jgi:hypothetical protein
MIYTQNFSLLEAVSSCPFLKNVFLRQSTEVKSDSFRDCRNVVENMLL